MSEEFHFVKDVCDVTAYRVTKPEGCNRTVAILLDKADGANNVSMGMCVIDPQSKIPFHTHENEEEAMYVLHGEGIFKIGDSEKRICEGSILFAPPKVGHQIINTSNKELRFIFVYSPAGPEQNIKRVGQAIGNMKK
ncbi:MAG: dimethylsulfonioproprionate lyase family protein [Nitrososphaeria archaeon]|nr:dimethylsulfonioproprionate lyase family protein [Nitrososphaeria archaeon]